MNKTFGWTEWDKHLLHFRGKPIKILEIGVYKGEAMEKFAQVFLESNNDAEYYGIDTWEGSPEYVEIDFKEIERAALGRKEASPRKNNIHFIKKESVIALPELVIKKIMFDIIYIDASHVAKDVLYDSTLAMKLLNINGIVIFDDYLWQKLEPAIFTPKPAIDSILNIFKDELTVLNMGYQVIAKKVNLKFLPKQTEKTIVDGFISLLNKYWHEFDVKNYIILLQSKELPKFEPEYTNSRDLSSDIEIKKKEDNLFIKYNLKHLIYKYCDVKYLMNDLVYKDKKKFEILKGIFTDTNRYIIQNFIIFNRINIILNEKNVYDNKIFQFLYNRELNREKTYQNIYKTNNITFYDFDITKKVDNIIDDIKKNTIQYMILFI